MAKSFFDFDELLGYKSPSYAWLPDEPKKESIQTAPTYLTTPTSPLPTKTLTDKEKDLLKNYIINYLKNYIKNYVKEELKKEVLNYKNTSSIIDRMQFIKNVFTILFPYVPNHPAVYEVARFINRHHLGYKNINLSNINMNSKEDNQLLDDIKKMKEVKEAIQTLRVLPRGVIIPCSRNLKKEGEVEFLKSFVEDIFKNPTRALLGSFNGTACTLDVIGNMKLIQIKIKNQLNWESLTRLPPSIGGYSFDGKQERSLVPHIKDWALDMDFEIRVSVEM